ncbi:hypothetical protein BAUCODRAFT_158151 [Baudoinia panamericana UAMH 10762]|uniref:Gfd2/YDR514C-like C-terminal domain-containing protein n=1 Tax=Baudoinia panamericana (strain UAMH 10762) TaxID=717646 RepID=M2N6B2_BAUPA|nr:uncharacterized protein BAUCODRAFT_158151 [Baudoinia panamericana UAMH 10762]EMC94574.1 hypothetical protein BAUCODRAFT_158151 [Baudoinia panamericana UAMH 10762]
MGLKTTAGKTISLKQRAEIARQRAKSAKQRAEERQTRQHVLDTTIIVQQPVRDRLAKPLAPRSFIKARPPPPLSIFATRLPRLRVLPGGENAVSSTAQQPSLVKRAVSKHPLQQAFASSGRRTIRWRKGSYEGPSWKGYPDIHYLRSLLGLQPSSSTKAQNAILVAIDTESERHGLINNVVEVGITTLKVVDIMGTEPGPHMQAWMPNFRHHHIVVDISRYADARMRSSLFGESKLMTIQEAARTVQTILRDVTALIPDPTVYLVGQSIATDVAALGKRPLYIDLQNHEPTSNVRFEKTFETLAFSDWIRQRGIDLPSARLGPVARWLGVDPRYHNPLKLDVRGVHNASNDAAYTMMVLLLYALKWHEILQGTAPRQRSAAAVYPPRPLNEPGVSPPAQLAPSQDHRWKGARARQWPQRTWWRVGLPVCLLGVSPVFLQYSWPFG